MAIPSQNAQNAFTGIAGVHYVVSELSRRGLIALPTVRNTAGTDIVLTNVNGTWHANLQVKASKNLVGFWPIGKRYTEWTGAKCWYAFLRYSKKEERYEVFLERAKRVAVEVKQNVDREKERGKKTWQPCWPLPKDEIAKERLRRQWRKFGLSQ